MHNDDNSGEDMGIDYSGEFSADSQELDPVLLKAIATLRELPPSDEGAVMRIVAAARVESQMDEYGVIKKQHVPKARGENVRSWRWVAAGLAAAMTFAVGYSTGIKKSSDSHDSYSFDTAFSDADKYGLENGANSGSDVNASLISQAAGAYSAYDSQAALIPVEFNISAKTASEVYVVGEFNSWSPTSTPLTKKTDTGEWGGVLLLAPGRHTYAFMIDGKIVPDPNAVNVMDPDYEVLVSTVLVKGYEVR